MKNKGFTLVESLFVVLISMFMFGVLLGVFFMGQKTFVIGSTTVDLQQKARFAMDRIANDLMQSQAAQVEISKGYTGVTDGDVIVFKTPQVTSAAVSGTMYNSDGTIKWGADGATNSSIRYLVPTTTSGDFKGYKGKLIKMVEKSGGGPFPTTTPPPTTTSPPQTEGPPPPDTCDEYGTCGKYICFLSGTTILMADGTTKAIEDIKVKDEVLGFDVKIKTLVKDKVSRVINNKAADYLLINNKIKVTSHHPFYSQGKWIEAGKLKTGDKLFNFKGEEIPIVSIQRIKLTSGVRIFNLEVKKHHTYFAEGFLVHNKKIWKCTGADCPGAHLKRGFDFKAFVKSLFSSIAFAEVTLDNPSNYNITIIADNITKINFDGCSQAGTCNDSFKVAPNAVKITITASKKSLSGQELTFTITSLVTLKN